MKKNISGYMISVFIFTGLLWLTGFIFAEKAATLSELFYPRKIVVHSNQIFISDYPYIYLYSGTDFRLLKRFGGQGQGPHPVVIVIHGGCWISKFASLQNTAPISSAICKLGIATWNIEYRMVDNQGGGWPGTFQDIAQAIDYLKNIAVKYNLDLSRAITVGHSAGGHLALWAAARNRIPKRSVLYAKDPLKIQGVVALSAAVDLKSLIKSEKSVCGDHVIPRLLGGTPDEVPQHYKICSPIETLPLGIPQILIVGESDIPDLKETGLRYRDLALKSGDRVKLYIIKKAGHHEGVAPGSVAWPRVKESIIRLMGIEEH